MEKYKNKLFYFLLVVLTVSLFNCAGKSQSIKMEDLPILKDFKTCTAVVNNYFQNELNAFSCDQNQRTIAWVLLWGVNKRINVQFKWYDPNGNLYHETEILEINKKKILSKYATAWHQIDITKMYKLNLTGDWKVTVLVDGKIAKTKTFRIYK